MAIALPRLFLARHGETAWTVSRQHTGRTDIPLTDEGKARAVRLGTRLQPHAFAAVFTSPLQRAAETCRLAGYGAAATVDPDLQEWDYGQYEGLTTSEILTRQPGWELFRDGCPGGESPDDVARRADRFIARAVASDGAALAFSSGHIIRMIAARWLNLAPAAGRIFYCQTASLGVLGFEHGLRDQPVIQLWNAADE